MTKLLLLPALILFTSSCTKQADMSTHIISTHSAYSYLALGDSYTIGEAVPQAASFPYQLRELLISQNIPVAQPLVIARTGWTTGELAAAIKEQTPSSNYDIVTLLIGVNNQYRGYSSAEYRLEFRALLQQAIGFARGDKSRVFVVSIPDWGVTAFGKASGRDIKTISAEIDIFNQINKEETVKMGVSYTDITPASRSAEADASLVAADGLHPSDKMYAGWAAELSPKIAGVLK